MAGRAVAAAFGQAVGEGATEPAAFGDVLVLHQVARAYRRGAEVVTALAGADLAVLPGESVAVVGRSGSGKSTLLHLAGGLDRPDRGEVRLAGAELASLAGDELARLRRRYVGFVFQFFHLLPALTVADNVALPFVLDGRRPDRARVDHFVDLVGLGHRRHHRPGELSGGELQRAAIARALIMGPSVILADEPTGNLDSGTSAQVLDVLFERVRADGAALVLVTHDRGAARRADRVVRLVDGRIR